MFIAYYPKNIDNRKETKNHPPPPIPPSKYIQETNKTLVQNTGGSRIECREVLSIPRALARAKFYVLRPLLTSFPHTTCYTKKK